MDSGVISAGDKTRQSITSLVAPSIIMDHVIVVRDYRPGDELQCKEILREGTMSTVNTAFFAGLTREITFQAMVVTSAVMFIFMGVPLSVCLGSIPVVIVAMYVIVYLAHTFKTLEVMQDIASIPRFYMSSDYTGFWVAEACEPMFMTQDPKHARYLLLTEDDMQRQAIQLASHLRRRIIGTIAITRSKSEENTAWMRRLAVHPRYQNKGIDAKLVDEALRFATEKGYNAVELVTSECQNDARELYLKKGFELKQMYHRHVFGSLVSILNYELTVSLSKKVFVNQ